MGQNFSILKPPNVMSNAGLTLGSFKVALIGTLIIFLIIFIMSIFVPIFI